MIPATTHVSFVAGGVRVHFPFEPYETQREYIESVIQALNKRQNALLESPTGTGKTLSLLCSTLAWLQSRTGQTPMVYYTSRTHMQLAQAAKEMKRSAYARNPAVVIGSRTQLCLNDEVKQQSGDHLINRACRNAITKNACQYYTNYEQKLESINVEDVNDIEDLNKFGKAHQCCPYYASKKIAENKASIVFMPYNYLLDTSLKKSFPLKLENSIIIFDEAHNIEGALKDAASGSFTQQCLSVIQDSCLKLPSKLSEAITRERYGLTRAGYNPAEKRVSVVDEFKTTSTSKTKEKEQKPNFIEELAEHLTTDRLQQVNICAESLKTEIRKSMQANKTYSTDLLFDALQGAGVSFSTSNNIITTLESMSSFWSIAGVMNPVIVAKYVGACSNLCRVIALLFPDGCLSSIKQAHHTKILRENYKIYLEGHYKANTVIPNSELIGWTLHLWCLHPAIGLYRVIGDNTINGPASIIVTSGTLAPMKPIEKSLGVKFPIMKEFKHVIGAGQLKVMVLGKSPSSYSLDSCHEENKKPQYPVELGKTLKPLFGSLPYGTLVFFPSYALMHRVTDCWKTRTNLWNEMCRGSSVYIEGKDQESFIRDVKAFKNKIDSRSRAVFIGVCRGKLSEGVSLEDNYCRSVIMIGLPYSNHTDPKVNATRKFHDMQHERGGQVWYSQQMARALNQTIGRVIRSKDDFGMLILCDPRFPTYQHCLSGWIRGYFPPKITDAKDMLMEASDFFLLHGIAEFNMSSQSNLSSADNNMGAFEFDVAPKRYKGIGELPKSQPQAGHKPSANPPSQSGQSQSNSQSKVGAFQQRKVPVDQQGNPTTLGGLMLRGINPVKKAKKRKQFDQIQKSLSASSGTSSNRLVGPEKGILFRNLQARLRN